MNQNEIIHGKNMHRKEKEVRTISWDSQYLEGEKGRAQQMTPKRSEMEETDQERVISQKPNRRE